MWIVHVHTLFSSCPRCSLIAVLFGLTPLRHHRCRINGQPSKPIGGKYMPLYQPRDGSQVGQVALSTREVSTHTRARVVAMEECHSLRHNHSSVV